MIEESSKEQGNEELLPLPFTYERVDDSAEAVFKVRRKNIKGGSKTDEEIHAEVQKQKEKQNFVH